MNTKHATPKSSRPYMPGYGILNASEGRGLLAWDWAVERLTKARNYWVATTCPDGRPHCVPVWGVWLDDAFYFSSGAKSRKARNLAANPNCVVCPEDGTQAISLEGVAEKITDIETIRRMVSMSVIFSATPSSETAWVPSSGHTTQFGIAARLRALRDFAPLLK